MKIGYSAVDITPPLGTPCALGLDDECQEIFDPIAVIAIALELDDGLVIITAADLLGLNRPETLHLRNIISNATNTPPERVVIHCTHSHESPSARIEYGEFLAEHGLRAYDPAYWEHLQRAWIQAATEALTDLAETTVSWGMERADRVASNRRMFMPDGSVTTRYSRAAAEYGAYPEGNIDPFVRVLRFDREEGAPIALVTYCCHPSVAGGDEGPYVTADICGVVRDLLASTSGCNALYMTGPCGNINPGKYAGLKSRTEDVATLGNRLASAAVKAYEDAKPIASGPSAWLFSETQLQLAATVEAPSKIRTNVLSEIQHHKELNAQGIKAPGGSVRRPLSLYLVAKSATDRCITTDVAAMRIANKAVVFYPGECFIELAQALSHEFDEADLAVVENCDYSPSYILTPPAYIGGYEASVCLTNSSSFGILTQLAVDLLRRHFQ